jgi:DNA-binding SARP family transcriptional activator/tetratricopeptide (TPR) repeat protein
MLPSIGRSAEDRRYDYRVLGPLEVLRLGRPVPIDSPAQRIVLAALLLRLGQPVSTDQLLDLLADSGPISRNALQQHVKRLRATIGGAGHIVHRHDGYLVPAAATRTDLARYGELVKQARTALHAGDRDTALKRFREATALFRGPILADVPCAALHSTEVHPLTERYLDTCEQRYELELDAGRGEELVEELTRLCAQHPLRERLLGLLMRTLYGAGRQVDALGAYRAHTDRLRTEFGLDPGRELRELELTILRSEPLTAPLRQQPTLPAPSRPAPPRQLPRAIADFVGRSAQLAEAERVLLDDAGPAVPVVTVTGSAGVGKSTFALHLAHRISGSFPDGQVFASLDGATARPAQPAELLTDLLVTLGVPAAVLPVGLSARRAMLRDRLAGRRMLLVLDDAGAAAQVEDLLPGTPGCAVIVTSRHALGGLASAHRIRMTPLSGEEGVDFLARVIGGARVAGQRGAAEEIVALCDGLPLALRIAGVRLDAHPSMPLTALADRLRTGFRRLDELATDGLAVRTGLALSYAGLDPLLKNAFRRVALLPPGDFAAWTLGQLVDGGSGEVAAERLVSAGLLQPAGADVSGEPRYRPHDLVALYAAELLARDKPAEAREAVGRLVDTMAHLGQAIQGRVTRIGDVLPPSPRPTSTGLAPATVRHLLRDPVAWARASRRHLIDTVRRACEYGWYDRAALVADLTFPVLFAFGDIEPFRRLYEELATGAAAAGADLVAWRAQYIRAGLLLDGELAAGAEILSGCVTAFRRLGARHELVYALVTLEFARSMLGQPVETEVAEALRVAGELDDPACLLLALRAQGESLLMRERPADALPVLSRALELADVVEDRSTRRILLNLTAKGLMAVGEVDRARAHLTAALELVNDGTNPRALAWLLIQRGRIALADDDAPAAIADAQQAVELHERLQDRRGLLSASVVLAQAHLRGGRAEAAAQILTTRVELLATADDRNLAAVRAVLDELGPDRAEPIRRQMRASSASPHR